MQEWLIGLVLGIVEGLTEFLPVSSTGHMILVGSLLGFEGETAKTFDVVVQLGSILAVVAVFWKRLWSVVGVGRTKETKLNLLHIIIGGLPAGVLGVLFHDFIKEKLFRPETVVLGLVLGGMLMIVADRISKPAQAETVDDITYKQAFSIGLFQCLALCPGFSRSGSTISGGILSGVSYAASAQFTFLLAVPMMLGASTVDLIKSWDILQVSDLPLFATGFGAAFVVALLAIVFFLKLIAKWRLTPFAYYRFVIAALFYWFVIA